jgi:BTB/POZ domain
MTAASRIDAMLASKWSILQSGKYSDLTIGSGDREFHVHKAVICPQSPFFMAACDGEFKVDIGPRVSYPMADTRTLGSEIK